MAFFGKPDPPSPPQPSTSVPPPPPNPPERMQHSSAAPAPTGSGATTVIGSRVRIVGDLSGDEDVVINGRLEGKIRVDRKVIVTAGAEVEGDVQAKSVTIGGRVHGQVMASERAELLPTGRVQGNVHAPRIVMAEGAQIQGRVIMPSDAATRPLSAPRVEEAVKRSIVPPRPETAPPKAADAATPRPETAPPKADDAARRPVSPPGTGG